jgi:hypothetical protein
VVFLLLALCGAGGLIACAGAVFDPRGRSEVLNSGVLSSFVSWVGLLFVPSRFPLYPDKNLATGGPLQRSVLLILLATVGAVSFVAILGPGIRFSL